MEAQTVKSLASITPSASLQEGFVIIDELLEDSQPLRFIDNTNPENITQIIELIS